MKKLFLLLGLASVLVMFANGCMLANQSSDSMKSAAANRLGIYKTDVVSVQDVKYHGFDVSYVVLTKDGKKFLMEGNRALFNISASPLSGTSQTPQVTAVPKQQ